MADKELHESRAKSWFTFIEKYASKHNLSLNDFDIKAHQQGIQNQNINVVLSKRMHINLQIHVTIRFHLISSQSLNLGGRRGATDDVATIPFHPSLSSAALRESPNSIPVHSLMLSFHLLFCLPLLLAPFTVPCRIVFAMPEDLEMWPYHLSFRFFTMVRRSSCTQLHSGFC